jgi:dsDNA-specific endonuclease/ATPase MutS2
MIGKLVECKHSGNFGIVLETKHDHCLVQFEIMKVWVRDDALEVLK